MLPNFPPASTPLRQSMLMFRFKNNFLIKILRDVNFSYYSSFHCRIQDHLSSYLSQSPQLRVPPRRVRDSRLNSKRAANLRRRREKSRQLVRNDHRNGNPRNHRSRGRSRRFVCNGRLHPPRRIPQ